MRARERLRGLLRSPWLLGRLLLGGRYDFCYDQMALSVRGMAWKKRRNLVASGLNLVHRRLSPWGMPLHMQFELTNYCNLRCPACAAGTHALDRAPRAIDPALFRWVLDEVGPYLLTASLWGWGEPLLHPALAQLLHDAARHGAATFLSTNGQTLDRDDLRQAILEAPPTHLIVAVDGLTDETHSRFRVGARLEPALAGVRLLAEEKRRRGQTLPILHMRFIAMKHNEHELGGLEAFASAHGFDLVTVRALTVTHTEEANPANHALLPDRPELRAFRYDDNQRRQRRRDHVCMEPFWFPTLFADGTVVACVQDFQARQPLGRVGEGASFADVWFGEDARRVRRTVRDQPQTLGFCRDCSACDRPATNVSFREIPLNPGLPRPLVLGR